MKLIAGVDSSGLSSLPREQVEEEELLISSILSSERRRVLEVNNCTMNKEMGD